MNWLYPRARVAVDDDVEEQQQATTMPEVAAWLDRAGASPVRAWRRREAAAGRKEMRGLSGTR